MSSYTRRLHAEIDDLKKELAAIKTSIKCMPEYNGEKSIVKLPSAVEQVSHFCQKRALTDH
jgi:hypothetical protein